MSQHKKKGRRIEVSVTDVPAVTPYDVYIYAGCLESAGEEIADACPAHRYAVVSDSHVAELHAERLLNSCKRSGLDVKLFKFPAGEWNKSREVWSTLTDALIKSGFGRDCAVIAFGGGVAGDLAAFVAATYMRGIPVVQIPTTLLAMVDSSVGGKTGVDTEAGKNLVGAFHQPRLVLIDPTILKTLAAPQLAAGLAEVLKHGLICDAAYFDRVASELDAIFGRDPDLLAEVIARSVEIKAQVVSHDTYESGYRRILNFGHTVAHAQETISRYGWLHGEAVAMGMVAEARIGEALGVTQPGVAARIQEAVEAARLPVELDEEVGADRFFEVLEVDKKRSGGQTRYTLLADVGRIAGSADGGWTHEVDEDLIRTLLFG